MTAAATDKRVLPVPCARLLSRVEAAAYCGVSPVTFDRMIRDKMMPKAKRIYSRTVWDVRALDIAIDELPGEDSAAENPWDDD